MTAPMSNGPKDEKSAVPNKPGNRLAVVSFVLAIAQLIVVVLAVSLAYDPHVQPHTPLGLVVAWTAIVLYVVGALAGVGAIFTGIVALPLAVRYPPAQWRFSLALVGLLMGLLVFLGYTLTHWLLFFLVYACDILSCPTVPR